MQHARFPLARSLSSLILPLLVLAEMGCNVPGSQEKEGFVIFGKVTANGVGVAGATVRADSDFNPLGSKTTAADGSYQFDGIDFRGVYSVSATAAGLDCGNPQTVHITVDDDSRQVDFVCTQPPAIIVVTVTSQGAPVSGAVVTLTGPSPGTGTTGAIGTATFTDRTPGSYGVSVTKAGLSCPAGTANPASGATANVAIICTALPATIVVTVQIGGSPVSGATVSLTGPTPQTGTTGGNGSVTFSGLLAGSYTVAAQQTGLLCGTATANPGPGETANAAITCAPATGTIVVTVRNGATSAPIAGASVTLSGPTPGSGTTNASGMITFAGLTPGGYTISTTAPGFTTCPVRTASIGAGATVTLFVDCTP